MIPESIVLTSIPCRYQACASCGLFTEGNRFPTTTIFFFYWEKTRKSSCNQLSNVVTYQLI